MSMMMFPKPLDIWLTQQGQLSYRHNSVCFGHIFVVVVVFWSYFLKELGGLFPTLPTQCG